MKNRNYGFSLVELMVVVVIIGILATVAVPQYTTYVQKSRRADAYGGIVNVTGGLERFYTNNNMYTTILASVAAPTTATSPDGWYAVTITTTGVGTARQTYTVTATATGDQLQDTDCRAFFINEIGVKSARNSAAATNANCW